MTRTETPTILRQTEEARWEGIPVMPYKEDGTHFKSITRQTLFPGEFDLPVETRYFEIGEGGHSTLEKHEHSHWVMVLRGAGRVLVRDRIYEIAEHDWVHIPPQTWHQFQPAEGSVLGFLCLVAVERDRPYRPNDADLEMLRSNPDVAAFIRV